MDQTKGSSIEQVNSLLGDEDGGLPFYQVLEQELKNCGFNPVHSDFNAELIIHSSLRDGLNLLSCQLLMCSYFAGFKADWKSMLSSIGSANPLPRNKSAAIKLEAVQSRDGKLTVTQIATLISKFMQWAPPYLFPGIFADSKLPQPLHGSVNMPGGRYASQSINLATLFKQAFSQTGATLVITYDKMKTDAVIWAFYRSIEKIYVFFPDGVRGEISAHSITHQEIPASFESSFMLMLKRVFPEHIFFSSYTFPLFVSPTQKRALLPSVTRSPITKR